MEPGLLGNIGKGEDVCGMLVKNVTRESRNHTEHGELSEMKECRSGEARHQNRDSIQLANMEAGCWVPPVTFCHTSVQDTRESFCDNIRIIRVLNHVATRNNIVTAYYRV